MSALSTVSWIRRASLTAAAGLVVATFSWQAVRSDEADEPAAEPADAAKEAAPAAEAAEEAKPAPKNPLGRFIKNLLPGPGRMLPIDPDGEGTEPADGGDKNRPANGDRTARDRTDARAPHDPDQAKLLRAASSHADRARRNGEEQEWSAAVTVLERILGGDEDSLIRLADGRWVSVREQASRMLAELPPEYIDLYRRNNAELAGNLLNQARREGDLDLLHSVAARFILTDAGQQAADIVGTLHFDRGEYGVAARWFKQLVDFAAPLTADPRWQLKAALAFRQSGDDASREKLLALATAAAQGQPVRLGNVPVDPAQWLEQVPAEGAAAPPVLDEWRMFLGNPSHTGTVAGGEPLLLPRWSQPLTYSHRVREQIETFLSDLRDEDVAALPAFSPIMVGGKVIFRTLRGVSVVDADTGRLSWETRPGVSPEQLLSGSDSDQDNGNGVAVARAFVGRGRAWVNGQMLDEYAGTEAQQHPLTRLLLSDGVYGLISSDGRQLFVVEDHAVLLPFQAHYRWGWNGGYSDPYRRDLTSNKIVSYDVESGRPRWEVGGTAMDEPFDLRLAGYYFFGAPVPDGDELFVVGEKDNEIRLFSLSAETGRPNWSQLVAYSDNKIEQDSNRRYYTAQPAVAKGVIVVPTTAGWMVGVDRMSRAVLWAHRYFPPNKNDRAQENGMPWGGYGGESLIPLNTTWGPSAPVVSGSRVVFTPSEGYNPHNPQDEKPLVVCLDLFSGKVLWQRPKENSLYLGGVHGGRALLVGTREVTAINADDGKVAWTLPIPVESGLPSGAGVAVGERYLLPLSSGELWTVALETGKLQSKAYLPEGSPALGNLGMYRGMLLSLGPAGLTAFEQRDAIVREIAARKAANPADAWALLREADIHLLNREHSQALAILERIDPASVAEEQRARYRKAVVETLAAVIREDLAKHDVEMEKLARFVESDAEKLVHARLRAETLQARQDWRGAFQLHMELAAGKHRQMVGRSDDATVKTAMPVWTAGQLADLWTAMPAGERDQVEPLVARAVEVALAGGREEQEQFVALFGFHPSAPRVRQRLAETLAEAGDFLRAERELLRLSRSADESVAAAALARLGQLMRDAGLVADAAHFEAILERRHGDIVVAGAGPDGGDVSARELVAARREADGTVPAPSTPSWTGSDVRVVMTQTNYSSNQSQEFQHGPYRLPFFQRHRFVFMQNFMRLGVMSGEDDELYWLLPLRSSQRPQYSGQASLQDAAHALFVYHGDVLHALSPVERKILWTSVLDGRGPAANDFHDMQQLLALQQLGSGGVLQNQPAGPAARGLGGAVPVANCEYVCIVGRRSLTVRDALTGEVLWTRERVPSQARILGTSDTLFIVGDDQEVTSLRARDGKRVEVAGAGDLLRKAIWVGPEGLLVADQAESRGILGLGGTPKHRLRLYDPTAAADVWTQELRGGHYTLLGDGTLAVVQSSGEISLIDVPTGRTQSLTGLGDRAARRQSQMVMLADSDRIYLFSSRGGGNYYSSSSGWLRTMQFNGVVHAFDRKTGEKQWEQKVTNQQLLLEQFGHSPLIVFSHHEYKQVDDFHMWVGRLLALDKGTGQVVADTKMTNAYGYPFHTMSLKLKDRAIDLVTHNMRVRLVASHPEEESVEAPTPATVK